MSLPHILLGMLRAPASGYDLKAAFDAGERHFWSAELSQIYPTLKRLEKQGMLASDIEPSTTGPDRKVYRRTGKGRAELRRWLSSGPVMGTQRFAYVAQLSFMDELGDLRKTLAFLEELRGRLTEFLELLQHAAGEQSPQVDEHSDFEFHDSLCLRMGLSSIAARIQWCDESIASVRARLRRQARQGRER